jgi:hypothetical protein
MAFYVSGCSFYQVNLISTVISTLMAFYASGFSFYQATVISTAILTLIF